MLFLKKQVQYYKYCLCIFSLCFLIFWGQGFVEVPRLLKSVSGFMNRILNCILRFVSGYVSNCGIMYRYPPINEFILSCFSDFVTFIVKQEIFTFD